jgi:hypothetical protein
LAQVINRWNAGFAIMIVPDLAHNVMLIWKENGTLPQGRHW